MTPGLGMFFGASSVVLSAEIYVTFIPCFYLSF